VYEWVNVRQYCKALYKCNLFTIRQHCKVKHWIKAVVLMHSIYRFFFYASSIGGGELFERIMDDSFEYTEVASERYMQQILEGTAYMHRQDIVHLDLKPENIVCVDHTGTAIKIIDFGFASKLGTKKNDTMNSNTMQLYLRVLYVSALNNSTCRCLALFLDVGTALTL